MWLTIGPKTVDSAVHGIVEPGTSMRSRVSVVCVCVCVCVCEQVALERTIISRNNLRLSHSYSVANPT